MKNMNFEFQIFWKKLNHRKLEMEKKYIKINSFHSKLIGSIPNDSKI